MIKIGTCVKGDELVTTLPHVIDAGFETIQIYFPTMLGNIDFHELSPHVMEAISDTPLRISSIGLYGNPLQYVEHRKELEYCIDHAHLFGANIIGTFAGALEGKSVDESMPEYTNVFRELVKRAEDKNVKIGIENCPMYGFWYRTTCNIGYCPKAWEMMFDAVNSDYLGLEWEPSHQLEQFIDPIAQLRDWMPKIVHIHGKDAQIDWEYIRTYGAWFGSDYSYHRFPGLGDSNWQEIINTLKAGGYQDDIAIEGYHDPEYYEEKEFEGQVMALEYLKSCR